MTKKETTAEAAYAICMAQNQGQCSCQKNAVGPCVAMVHAAREHAKAAAKPRRTRTKAQPEGAGIEAETTAEAAGDGARRKLRAALTTAGKTMTPGGMTRVAHVVLPPDCPVKALGKSGRVLYFADALGQLHELHAEKVGRPTIVALFGGATDWLYELWPKWRKGELPDEFFIDDWVLARAQESLFEAAHAKGLWEPHLNVRGRGGWALDDGRLALHTGRAIYLSDGSLRTPGAVDLSGHIYPAAESVAQPMPTEGRKPFDGRTASLKLLDVLTTWNWRREFDARLLLGWTAAGMVGGALRVRPMGWITGPRGAGKSGLTGENGVLDLVLNGGAVLSVNTSAAGIYQKLRYDSLPVILDEIEAKRGSAKTEAVIELMRQGFSGGALLRGGADHGGVEFRARSAMLFSSILIPPLLPQDQSRLAILNLMPFPPDAVEPAINKAEMRAIGAAMLRRWLERWAEWPERLDRWRAGLKRRGHDGRGQDAFGTLLAAADLMLSDTAPDEDEVDAVCAEMGAGSMAETRQDDDALYHCVHYAMSRSADRYRGGELMTIGEWVRASLMQIPEHENGNPPGPAEAARVLGRYGIAPVLVTYEGGVETVRLVTRYPATRVAAALSVLSGERPTETVDGWVGLAFANNGEGILSLFEGSNWEGVPGARNPYTQALERLPGAVMSRSNVRIGAYAGRVVVVPVQECLPLSAD